MGGMMKKVQEMQAKMQEMQKELENKTIEAESGGGMVKVVMNGKQIVQSINIDPSLLSEEEKDVLEDVWAFERSGYHKGLYHVIGGLLSAAKNFTEQDLKLNKLRERIEINQAQEIILALSATIEGQTTALVIKDALESLNIKITQLAYGVPVGSEIHYLDDNTLGAALESRKNLG